MMRNDAYDRSAIVSFLKHRLLRIPGKLLVVWARLSTHRSRVIKEFLRASGAARLHLAQLPSYAPDLNPDQGVWNYLNQVELRNVCCYSLSELRDEIRKAIARLATKSLSFKASPAQFTQNSPLGSLSESVCRPR